MEIQRSRSRIILTISILFVLAVLVTGGTLGYFWYRKHQEQSQSSSSSSTGGSIALDSGQKLETETIQTSLLIPKSTDKPGNTIKLSAMTITVPKSWRTINGKNIINTPLQNVYAESTNDVLAQLIMVPEQNPTDPLLASNSLSLYNITSWLKQPSTGASAQVTPAMKSAYITNIQNMGGGAAANTAACSAKGVGVLNPAVCGNLLKSTAVSTNDGTLKGIAYLNTTTQSVGYYPEVLVMMAGQVKDQQVFLYGDFHLLDNNTHQLSATDTAGIKSAWASYVTGNVPSDTMQLYQHVVDAVKSIGIQAN